mmetsp:Transcript_14495/g.24998  ORF Transcript_14495/g.24998 Transcript_14495/m.24998 type:complete len:80 (-) Transcript_14495:481-720(-)
MRRFDHLLEHATSLHKARRFARDLNTHRLMHPVSAHTRILQPTFTYPSSPIFIFSFQTQTRNYRFAFFFKERKQTSPSL